ncbi:MAG: putative lipid II flippase FtsW [Micrococcaceae bacterium]
MGQELPPRPDYLPTAAFPSGKPEATRASNKKAKKNLFNKAKVQEKLVTTKNSLNRENFSNILIKLTQKTQLTFKKYFPTFNRDSSAYYMILFSTYVLVGLGLLMVLSASSVESIRQGIPSYSIFLRQAIWAILGLVVMHIVARIPRDRYQRWGWPAMILTYILLILVQLVGYEVNGNKNWIRIGPISGQPSEFAKFALCIWLPGVLAMNRKYLSDAWILFEKILVPSVPVILLVLIGHDMGTSIVISLIIFGAIFVSGVPMRIFTFIIGIGVVGAAFFALTDPNRLARITTWGGSCNSTDIQGMCWQSQAGLFGLASGGWFGLGLGSSREKWSWLPEAHNDYIFAVIGEELGFFGAIIVVALFCTLAIAFLRVVLRHSDPYIRIATSAVLFWIMGQAIINMGMVTGALPVIGVPLPLISAGGTAVLFALMAIGMVLSFARTEAKPGDARRTNKTKYRNAAKSKPLKRKRKLPVISR